MAAGRISERATTDNVEVTKMKEDIWGGWWRLVLMEKSTESWEYLGRRGNGSVSEEVRNFQPIAFPV